MRSRVEIVARKSDHICVVRDVPDMRGSWYQRQQQSIQSNYSQHSSSGSLDHPVPPAAALAAASSGAATTSSQQQASLKPGAAAPGAAQVTPTQTLAAPSKPSFAALFGKHPAIKEEPTTPGGTLTSETPPPMGQLSAETSASIGGKRSPFKRGLLSSASGASGAPTSPASSPAPSSEQIGQIISLLNELKSDINQNISQLSKRVDSMDASVSKVTQTVAKLDKHYTASLTSPDLSTPLAPLAPPAKASSWSSPHSVRAHTSSSILHQESDQPPPGDLIRATGTGRHSSSVGVASSSLKPASASTIETVSDVKPSKQATPLASDASSSVLPSRDRSRERSKSPHKHHHHHHHHHHHRKAQHPTPSATPTSSQVDLSKIRPPTATTTQALSATTTSAAPSSSGVVELTSALTKPSRTSKHGDETGSKRISDQSSAIAKQSSMTGQQRPTGSSEQSDDDQDATSKL